MITCLNMFLSKNSISSDLIPAAIFLGSPNPDYNKLNITFGAYAQVNISTTYITNQRTVGAIAIRTENERRWYYCMSLATGKHLRAFIWVELTINDRLIQRVIYLATKDKYS